MGFSDNQKFIWPAVISAVLIAFASIQVYRANYRPADAVNSKPAVRYTTGTVVDERLALPAGGFLSYRIDLNRRSKLKGTFTTGKDTMNLSCVVLMEEELEAWKSGGTYKKVAETGYVPRGHLDAALEPGAYYLIFDNRRVVNAELQADAHFSVE